MRLSVLITVLAVAGCSERTPPAASPEGALKNAPAPGTSEVDRPHVVFTRDAITLARIGVPVAPPVTTPSRPGQDTMQSDDPTVVAVDANGALVGMRSGATTIRGVGSGSSLSVTVLAGAPLRITPAALTLAPGSDAAVAVQGGDGPPLAPETVRWTIPEGTPVAVVNGRVMSLGKAGRFEVEAAVGEVKARLPVEVRVPGSERIVVSPARARVRAGQVASFRLFGGTADIRADWTSSEPRVVAPLGGGLFQAQHAGKAKVCATALDRTSCSDVEVRP